MNIRDASRADLPAIVAMAKEIVDRHHRLDPYYKAAAKYKNLENDLAEWLEDGDVKLLAATEGQRLVGYFRAAVEDAPSYVAAKRIGVIYDIFVSEEFRRRGIGAKLLHEALNWFRSKKIKDIEVSVDARNREAVEFWKSDGFFEYKLRLRKTL